MKLVPQIRAKLRRALRKPSLARSRHARHKRTASTITASLLRQHNMLRVCGDFPNELNAHLHADQSARILPKATPATFLYDGTFHEAISRVLVVAECFALMPVKGVTARFPEQLSFSWYHLRTIYSVVFIVATVLDLGLALYFKLQGTITFNTLEPLIFRFSIAVVCASALNLARKWPGLMADWALIERDLPQYQTQVDKRQLAYQIQHVTFVAMMLSLGEHLMSVISGIYLARSCPFTSNPIENFFLITNAELFHVFTYSAWLALLGKVENVLSTFIWNYMDVFVMIISIGLTAKFKQLNDDLYKFKGMQMPAAYWAQRRIQYRQLCMLCEKMDNAIAVITMVSFSNNLYFICVQLLKSLNKMPPLMHAMYFYYSLIFLLGRTLAVSLYTAAVNDESRRPLRVIRCVPRESWCAEVKRFASEVSSELVALSGMKFFHLTRKLVLSVAGTIVTYELVLMQFHANTQFFNCTSNTA